MVYRSRKRNIGANSHVSNEAPNREIPHYLIEDLRKSDVEGLVKLYAGKYEEAEAIFRNQYAILLDAQEKEHRPIHKGGSLHNLGLSLFGQKKNEAGLRQVLLAYIEDALNVPYDLEEEADRTPAARVLRDFLQIRLRVLREIRTVAREIKAKGLWKTAWRPEPILEEVVTKLGLQRDNLLSQCLLTPIPEGGVPLGFPQPWEQRVFIGANYDTHSHIVPEVKEVVVRKGYTPVIAYEVNIPQDLSHHHSLMLLHTCKYAVFEVTSYAGQLMELERAKDYGVTVLLVRSALGTPPLAPHVSSMIQTLGYSLAYYRDIPSLKQCVASFLP